jgi:hypothetical protein
MTLLVLLHPVVLFAHLLVFALTFSAMLRESWHLIWHRRMDAERTARSLRAAMLGLSALWTTGIALVICSALTSHGSWDPSARLSVLTTSGIALLVHALPLWAAPERPQPLPRPRLAVALGAVHGASWICAALIGVAHHLSTGMSLTDFLALYGAVIGVGLALGLLARWSRPGTDQRPAVQTPEG